MLVLEGFVWDRCGQGESVTHKLLRNFARPRLGDKHFLQKLSTHWTFCFALLTKALNESCGSSKHSPPHASLVLCTASGFRFSLAATKIYSSDASRCPRYFCAARENRSLQEQYPDWIFYSPCGLQKMLNRVSILPRKH